MIERTSYASPRKCNAARRSTPSIEEKVFCFEQWHERVQIDRTLGLGKQRMDEAPKAAINTPYTTPSPSSSLASSRSLEDRLQAAAPGTPDPPISDPSHSTVPAALCGASSPQSQNQTTALGQADTLAIHPWPTLGPGIYVRHPRMDATPSAWPPTAPPTAPD